MTAVRGHVVLIGGTAGSSVGTLSIRNSEKNEMDEEDADAEMVFLLIFVFCHCIHAGEKRTADIGTGTAGSTDRFSVSALAVNFCALLL